ncbi:MAG: hypothetical protein V4463_14135 [Pseudomonadota bacterium]
MALTLSLDRLDEVLDAAARKDAVVPSHFRNCLAFISLREPGEVDRDALRRFLAAVRERVGLALTVVGASYGCVKIFLRASEVEISGSPEQVAALFNSLKADGMLCALLMQALGSSVRVQGPQSTLNVLTKQEEALGHGGQPIVVVQGNVNIVGQAGVVGDHASVEHIQTEAHHGEERRATGGRGG